MLKNVYDSLKIDGYFVLDYTNPAYIFQNFKEHQTFNKIVPEGELIIHKHSQADLRTNL